MEFEQLWDIIIEKNINLKTDTEVRMTVNGFKKALKLAFDKGYDEGIGLDDEHEPPLRSNNTKSEPFDFNKFFDKFRK